MSTTTIFYILGLGLVAAALVVAAIGLRKEDWPSSGALKGVLPVFAALVIATMVFAVRNAQSESDKTEENKEAAAKLQEVDLTQGVSEADNPDSVAPSSAPATPEQNAQPSEGNPAGGAAVTLDLTSPAAGDLNFDKTELTAKAGTVEIDYDNPSEIPHSIDLEDSSGQVLASSQPGVKKTFMISADLKPGTYTYFCPVEGHREAGMEGKLVVK